ncbi:MAG TPA: sterol desaturase family protein [Burkholderiaceae bacterium]|nr:sterol desaturase family protein [Burkholderiaceae bacterium]
MRMSGWGCRADRVVYPLLLAAAGLASLWRTSTWQAEEWLGWSLAGVGVWTLLEYVLHRWVLHRVPPFKRLHEAHHAHPGELIGTPTWISAPLFVLAWSILAHELSRPIAGGAAVGLMLGYLAYSLLHDAAHHRRAAPGSRLARVKQRHARHHRPGANGDFGVSTGLWDRVFRTATAIRGADDRRAGR